MVCLIEAGTRDFFIMQESIVQFLPWLGLASYLCFLLLYSFLTTKRHHSDV